MVKQLYLYRAPGGAPKYGFNRSNAEAGYCPLHGEWDLKQGHICPACRRGLGTQALIDDLEQQILYLERYPKNSLIQKELRVLESMRRRAIAARRDARRKAHQEAHDRILQGVMEAINE